MKKIDAIQFEKEVRKYSRFLLSSEASMRPIDIYITFNRIYVGICGDTNISLKNECIEVHLKYIHSIYKEKEDDRCSYTIYCYDYSDNTEKPTNKQYVLTCFNNV